MASFTSSGELGTSSAVMIQNKNSSHVVEFNRIVYVSGTASEAKYRAIVSH